MFFASILDSISDIGALIGAVGVIVAIIFGALGARNKATVSELKESNAAKDELLATVKLQLDNAKSVIIEKDKALEISEQKARVLEDQVTQAPSINRLAMDISTQHKQTTGALTKLAGAQGKTATELGKLTKVLSDKLTRESL